MGIIYSSNTVSPQPTLSTPGTAQQVSDDDIFTKRITITAANSNTGNVYIDRNDANAKANKAEATLEPGDVAIFEAPGKPGGEPYHINVADLWFDGDTAGNKLIVTYTEKIQWRLSV